jgi:hypothetical protein
MVGKTVDTKIMKSYSLGSFKMYFPPLPKSGTELELLSHTIKGTKNLLTNYISFKVKNGQYTVSAIPKDDGNDDMKHVSKPGNEMNERKKHELPKGIKIEKILSGEQEMVKGLKEVIEQGEWVEGMGLEVLLFRKEKLEGYCQQCDTFFESRKDGKGHAGCDGGGRV